MPEAPVNPEIIVGIDLGTTNSLVAFADDTGPRILAANGVDYEVWDVTAQGVPHDLGVLGHYDLVIWELGDNRLTQTAEGGR